MWKVITSNDFLKKLYGIYVNTADYQSWKKTCYQNLAFIETGFSCGCIFIGSMIHRRYGRDAFRWQDMVPCSKIFTSNLCPTYTHESHPFFLTKCETRKYVTSSFCPTYTHESLPLFLTKRETRKYGQFQIWPPNFYKFSFQGEKDATRYDYFIPRLRCLPSQRFEVEYPWADRQLSWYDD